jgi:EAL domain-containing protein (putative c-di-GMP-specific phosphodiesterase class I)
VIIADQAAINKDAGLSAAEINEVVLVVPHKGINPDEVVAIGAAIWAGSAAIVRAVGGLGKSLGIPITAEGVETEEELALLRSEGTEPQGWMRRRGRRSPGDDPCRGARSAT